MCWLSRNGWCQVSNLGAEKRKVRKNLQQMYQSVVNRRQARAIAFRPQSEEGQRAWTTYLSLSSSSQE